MRHPGFPCLGPREVTLCQDTREHCRSHQRMVKSQCEVTHSSSHPHLPKASEFSNRQLFSAGPSLLPSLDRDAATLGTVWQQADPAKSHPFNPEDPGPVTVPRWGRVLHRSPGPPGSRRSSGIHQTRIMALAEVLAQEPGG